MASPRDDDFSDSDDEDLAAELETDVLLGIPDGDIANPSDLNDVAVSRIGGLPALLPTREPSLSSSQCKNCSYPMELLVQLWCPFENSEMDRALYVWGCSRASCQRKDGSVRAWRGLRYNAEYAKKLSKRKEAEAIRQAALAKEEAKRMEQQAKAKANPFKMTLAGEAANPFGLGAQIFGAADVPSDERSTETEDIAKNSGETQPSSSGTALPVGSEDEEDLVVALASTTLEESAWTSAPSYKPLYLSTVAEYIPPPPKVKAPQVSDGLDDDSTGTSGALGVEAYENSLETDHVFDRFSKRVSYEGEQCIRYELNGVPLPFASDSVFEGLFPVPQASTIAVSKAAFTVTPDAGKRTYRADRIPSCSRCGGARVFECQLMPNLINVLGLSSNERRENISQTDEERRLEVERLLKGGTSAGSDGRGMEWGTCMVFSCEKDCCVTENDKNDAQETWCEEVVFVQWDD